ncbi:conserved hypothetical protein [Rhodospirillaceae bacterium LM-1]|nr:conserved hypothetical protein [Rhodospirillaceae bacterium LM-1]
MSVTFPFDNIYDSQPVQAPGVPFAAKKGEQAPFAGQSDTPSFWDFVDAINPLQHLPVISTIYRAITGDEIAPVPRIVGGMLFGGPLGLIGAIANETVRQDTGQDLGEHAMAFLFPQEAQPQFANQGETLAQPGGMTMQAFEPVNAQTAQAAGDEEPPMILPQPPVPVASAPLPLQQAQAPQAQGAITGSLFVPLNQPLSMSDALPPAEILAAAPAAASLQTPAAAVPPPSSFMPAQATLAAERLASAGAVQPLTAPPTAPGAVAAASSKTFEAKASPLQHGKMFAAAAPYMNKVDPAQKVAQAQGVPATHPMLLAAQSGQSDWMAGAMTDALEKYSRTQKLVPETQAGGPPS